MCPRAARLCSRRPGARVLSATSLRRRTLNCWSVRLAAVVTEARAQSQTSSLGFSPPGRGSRRVPPGPPPRRASVSSSRTCSLWSLWRGRVRVPSRPLGLHPLRPRAPSTCRLWGVPAAPRPAPSVHMASWHLGRGRVGRFAGRLGAPAVGEWVPRPWPWAARHSAVPASSLR